MDRSIDRCRQCFFNNAKNVCINSSKFFVHSFSHSFIHPLSNTCESNWVKFGVCTFKTSCYFFPTFYHFIYLFCFAFFRNWWQPICDDTTHSLVDLFLVQREIYVDIVHTQNDLNTLASGGGSFGFKSKKAVVVHKQRALHDYCNRSSRNFPNFPFGIRGEENTRSRVA